MNQLPPSSEEAERGVLGSALIEPERVLGLCSEKGLSIDSFYFPTHRYIYGTLSDMEADGLPIDLLTAGNHLKDAGKLDYIGGANNLEGLIDSTPTSAHAEFYMEAVQEKYRLRQAITACSEGIDTAHAGEDATSIIARVSEALHAIEHKREERSITEDMSDNLMVLDEAQKGKVSGVPIPFAGFSEAIGGLQRSSMIPLVGRDGTGKSGLLAQFTDFWIKKSIPVLAFSLEDVKRRLLLRMGGCRMFYSARGVETCTTLFQGHWQKMCDEEVAALRQKMLTYRTILAEAERAGLFAVIDRKMTVEEICSLIRHHKRKRGIEIVTIDGFKDIIYSKGKSQTECERHIAAELQKVAKDTGVCLPVVSHIHKIEDHKAISKTNIMGSSVQFQGARQILIFQDAGIDGVDGLDTFALSCSKSNFTRSGSRLIRRDKSVLVYEEI